MSLLATKWYIRCLNFHALLGSKTDFKKFSYFSKIEIYKRILFLIFFLILFINSGKKKLYKIQKAPVDSAQ